MGWAAAAVCEQSLCGGFELWPNASAPTKIIYSNASGEQADPVSTKRLNSRNHSLAAR